MPFEGYLTSASPTEISGWVYLNTDPDAALPLEIVSDGTVIATIVAGDFRPDLLGAGKGNGCHAFSFQLPEARSSTPLRARVVGQPWFVQQGGAAYSRTFAYMRHTCEYGIPEVPNGFSEIPPADPDREIPLIQRLLAAYHRVAAKEAKHKRPEDLWSVLEQSIFPDFIDMVQRKDAGALAEYMRQFFAKTISHGTYQGALATAGLENPGSAAYVAGFIADSLASVAEAIGLLRVENPEQGHYGENLFRQPDEILDRITNELKINPVAPNVAGRKFGVSTRRGIVSLTDLRALYAAYRIREIVSPAGRGASVCEIGGGIGCVAFYAQLLGVKNYTIIDIPAISFMQGYWLSRALPDVPVTFYGERSFGRSGIRLLPPSSFGKSKFDLVYNQDSFPEMHRSHSVRYLLKARSITPLLLSINQEGENPQTPTSNQPVVADLIAEVGRYRRLYRFHNWVRAGYVEELYETQPPSLRWAVKQAARIMEARKQIRLSKRAE
jgi:hypothetical protein